MRKVQGSPVNSDRYGTRYGCDEGAGERLKFAAGLGGLVPPVEAYKRVAWSETDGTSRWGLVIPLAVLFVAGFVAVCRLEAEWVWPVAEAVENAAGGTR